MQRRVGFNEPYRTLLGHFRHEIAHYYWEQLIANTTRLARFRELFGTETLDYAAALKNYYDHGAPADWQTRHVSAYASSHPWDTARCRLAGLGWQQRGCLANQTAQHRHWSHA